MRLKIEIEDNQYADFDFEDILFITGKNQNLLWKLYRSLFFYFEKAPMQTKNIYGDDGIEVKISDEKVSVKHNQAYFINSRNSIYEQMIYKKDSMLFDVVNDLNDEKIINRYMEQINDEIYKLNFLVQDKLSVLSDSLQLDIQDANFLDLLKNNLEVSYLEKEKIHPLSFMSTDELIDEYLKFIEYRLSRTANTVWIILYNLNSYISDSKQVEFLNKLRILMNEHALKIIFIDESIENLNLSLDDVGKIVVTINDYEQLLPFDQFKKSIINNYPNELDVKDDQLLESLQRIIPFIGFTKKIYLPDKDLVLLKVVNQILDFKTLEFSKHDQLTSAEAKFLEDNE